MHLKEYKNLPWPLNLWSTVLRRSVSREELPEDWEQALKYVLTSRIDARKAEFMLSYFRDGMTMQAVGDSYGLTLETIRQHISKTIRTMYHPAWRVFLIYGIEKGKAVLAEERSIAERQRVDGRGADTAGCLIEALDLSVRTYNCLKRAGINTVEELSHCSDKDLMQIRSMGKKSRAEVKSCLAAIRNSVPAPDLVSREALIEAIEHIDWYSTNSAGELHSGAADEDCAFVRYADVEAVIKALPSLTQRNDRADTSSEGRK